MTLQAAMLRRAQRVPLAACPPVPQRIAPCTNTGRQAASGTPPPIVSCTRPRRADRSFMTYWRPWLGPVPGRC